MPWPDMDNMEIGQPIKVRVRLPERKINMIATKERLRGFMSQYVIARAPSFNKDKETEDAWECMLRARTIFHAIDKVADAEPEDQPSAQQAGPAMVGAAMVSNHRFDPANNYRVPPDPRRFDYPPLGILTEEQANLSQGTLAKLYKAAMGRITPNDRKK